MREFLASQSSKAIYDRLIYGKSCDVHLYDSNTQSFDISYINWDSRIRTSGKLQTSSL